MKREENDDEQAIRDNTRTAKLLAPQINGAVGEVRSTSFDIEFGRPDKGVRVKTDDQEKFIATLLWPKVGNLVYYPTKRDYITIAKKRGVKILANEIKRRLLKFYAKEWIDQDLLAQGEVSDKMLKEQTIKELNTLVGNKFDPTPRELESGNLHCAGYNLHAVKTNHDGRRCSIETFMMPLSVAKQVIALIKDLNKDED